MTVTIESRGLNEAIDNLNRMGHELGHMTGAMQQSTLVVTRSAKQNAPVDRGVTRASITPSVESRGNETVGVVGSNLMSALVMEVGARPHWPPLAALEVWARRHGTTAFLVARAIARRGIKARRYLQRALDDNTARIVKIFNDSVGKIVRG